jgi:endonuclease/exonuclease/phosphatase family metal-dependent hydrolase
MGLVLATFNVLDLFDGADSARIERIAALLRPHGPDVVALQEIGDESAAVALEAALGGGYKHVLGDTDDRGIRCALLTRRPIITSNVLRATTLDFPRFFRADAAPFDARVPLRRAIPEVVVDGGDIGRVRVLVVHFKSRRGTPMRDDAGAKMEPTTTHALAEAETRAVVWRCAEALFVRRVVDERLLREPNEMLVVCGDFNDVAGSLPLRIVAGVAQAEGRPDELVSCAERVPLAERVSVMHDGQPAAIDHVLLSHALATRLERCFYERTGLGDVSAEGAGVFASDHAPLVVRFA